MKTVTIFLAKRAFTTPNMLACIDLRNSPQIFKIDYSSISPHPNGLLPTDLVQSRQWKKC